MIGVFDSGVGGLISYERLRELRPRADIIYFADRKNAPYGVKSESELISLVSRDIELLLGMGADKILAACCTACSIAHLLPPKLREKITTIIAPTAEAAVKSTKNGKIAILCTHQTAKSRAFEREIHKFCKNIELKTQPSAKLVALAEGGARDGKLTPEQRLAAESECEALKDFGADTVILGCTHFSHLKNTLSEYLGAKYISAADEGALLMASIIDDSGNGRDKFVCQCLRCCARVRQIQPERGVDLL